jgi:sigma-B regulation protein RsbU (phosphoserine phosphatase)
MVRWTLGTLRDCVSVVRLRGLLCPVYFSKLGSQMRIAGRVSKQFLQRLMLAWVAIVCAMPAIAQPPAAVPSATSNLSANNSAAAGIQGVINLTGPWRFQIGDDPRWADPNFDDSSWPVVTLDEPLTGQGVEPYSGFAWYRIRLEPRQLAEFDNLSTNTPLDLMVTGVAAGQLAAYVNGVEAGQTRGMTDHPAMFQSVPFSVRLAGPEANGTRILAIRTWAEPGVQIHRGLLAKVEIGTHDDISDRIAMATGRQWNENVSSAMMLAFLFLCVALLGAALYIAQRNHSEYLWLALMCLSVALTGAAEVAFGLAWTPLSIYRIFTQWSGRIFMAVTLEFVLRFTGSKSVRAVRVVQVCVLLLPILSLLHLGQFFEILSIAAEVVFCVLVCILLFRGWRQGRQEAGIMLVPFFLAATADSVDAILDAATSWHWLPERFASHRFHFGPVGFGTGTISYSIFLGSLVAVVLYRFIRVSQDEQRSNAEISAARSVQALLIPTQLPSTRNFMLESAYLPVHGVGGDFFQVLPLKDDSLLIVVGDVSGKGLQAAMNSSTLVGALRNELSHDPGTVLNHLNHVLLGAVSAPGAVPGLDSAPCFATCLCARIYPDGTLVIANAGHLSPYRDGRELQLSPSLPLGVVADAEYEQKDFHLERGDRLVFLSDGVVEATNQHGELFGFERTQQVSNESARYIAQTAQRFGQTDDITVVSLYVTSRAAERSSHEAAHTR